jgi:hypothetical protein
MAAATGGTGRVDERLSSGVADSIGRAEETAGRLLRGGLSVAGRRSLALAPRRSPAANLDLFHVEQVEGP